MSFANQVRQHCKEKYVSPARRRHQKTVTIISGKVHNELKKELKFEDSRLPGVCGAIGANEFEKMCNVTRLCVDGPLNGASTLFVFKLL